MLSCSDGDYSLDAMDGALAFVYLFPNLLAAASFWCDIQEVSANCEGSSHPTPLFSINDECW